MAANGKYTEEIVQKIAAAIEESGRDEDGYSAGRIGHDTFYRWIREKPEFAKAVKNARKHFQEHSIPNLKRLAKKALKTHLECFDKMETVHTVREITNPDGSVTRIEETKTMPAKVNMLAVQYALKGFDAKLARYEQEIDTADQAEAAEVEEAISVQDRLREALGIPTAEVSERMDR